MSKTHLEKKVGRELAVSARSMHTASDSHQYKKYLTIVPSLECHPRLIQS